MMRKATKKPVQIEFMTYEEFCGTWRSLCGNGTVTTEQNKILNLSAIVGEYDSERCGIYLSLRGPHGQDYSIKTLEGEYRFSKDDVLIKGVKGELYPCKQEIFYETYDIQKG